MKIEYRKGDLLKTEIPYIAHGCNAQGVMGSGVAKVIREKWPLAFQVYWEDYIEASNSGSGFDLGDVSVAHLPDVSIFNMITQEYYGHDGREYVSYDAIDLATKRVQKIIPTAKEIAMPMIGSGLGGGDWHVISTIIETNFTKTRPVVYSLD